jgi:hypothetical protein
MRVLDHHSGTPGIFFKFNLDPMSLTIHQRTSAVDYQVGGLFLFLRISYS